MHYLFQILGILLLGMFLKLDGYHIVKEQVCTKYKKWTRLKNMVSTRYKSHFTIIYVSLKLIFQALYICLIQYLNKSLIKIDKNNYELTYVINGKLYKNRLKIKRGPKPVLQVINNNDDITDIVLPYLGPEFNWHGNKLTPHLLGYKALTFELSDGTEKVYNENEVLNAF